MQGTFVDVNSRTVQIVGIGPAKDYNAGDTVSSVDHHGIVRFKNIGSGDGRIRLKGATDDGIVISQGETEYFGIYPGEEIEIITGSFNIM